MHRLKINNWMALILAVQLGACTGEQHAFDASGAFEAEEYLISSEISGRLLSWDIQEGDLLDSGRLIGHVDSVQLVLSRKQLEQQIASILSRRPNVAIQLSALESQLATARSEEGRIGRLVEQGALPSKQLDDLRSTIRVLEGQIDALHSQLVTASDGIDMDARTLQTRIDQLNDQIHRCRIINPVSGRVLSTYVKAHEMAVAGRPLYKVADLSEMTLKAYLSGDQLAQVVLGQEVHVRTDAGDGNMRDGTGTVYWISDKAEFTPKTIQTKNERANLVYAVKVRIPNDQGFYKIGMYGEVEL